jgi:hypothetical protein
LRLAFQMKLHLFLQIAIELPSLEQDQQPAPEFAE